MNKQAIFLQWKMRSPASSPFQLYNFSFPLWEMLLKHFPIGWNLILKKDQAVVPEIKIGRESPVSLFIQSHVRGLIQGISNILFWIHCVLKQNNWDTSYDALYEALNEYKYWALEFEKWKITLSKQKSQAYKIMR